MFTGWFAATVSGSCFGLAIVILLLLAQGGICRWWARRRARADVRTTMALNVLSLRTSKQWIAFYRKLGTPALPPVVATPLRAYAGWYQYERWRLLNAAVMEELGRAYAQETEESVERMERMVTRLMAALPNVPPSCAQRR